MKKLFYLMSVLVIIFGLTVTAYAISFSDNFNDGNADGWTFVWGTWSVVNGTLLGTGGGDDDRALVNNLVFSHQIIDVKENTYSYGGVVFWYQDNRTPTNPNDIHFTTVVQYGEGILIMEVAVGGTSIHYWPTFDLPPIQELVWHDLEVDANSSSGKVKIYIDGNYVTTYDSTLPKEIRIGQSGLYAGNSGAYFDDFSVKSVGKSVCVPEPSTMLLLGLGLIGLAGVRRKFKK